MRNPLPVLFLACLGAGMSQAQEPALQREAVPVGGALEEYFDRSRGANVGGGIIVGAVLGGLAAGPFLADHVLIATPVGGQSLCLRAISRDGFYSARNRYELLSPADGKGGTLLNPFSNMAEDLRDYQAGDIALVGTLAQNDGCLTGAKQLIPRLGTIEGERAELLLQLNAGGRGAAWIEQAGQADIECQPVAADLLVGFDMTCRLGVTLGESHRIGAFDLVVDDGLQQSRTAYEVVLPGRGG